MDKWLAYLPKKISSSQLIKLVAVVAVLALLATTRSPDGREMQQPSADQKQSIAIATTVIATTASAFVAAPAGTSMTLTTPWSEGAAIDARYTCKAESVSPPLQFADIPGGAVTLALVLTDIDTNNVVHWAMANISPADTTISEGVTPNGAIQALTAQGTSGYWAPCPPAGKTHTYRLTGYAISQQLEFADGVDAATLVSALEASSLIVVETTFTATST